MILGAPALALHWRTVWMGTPVNISRTPVTPFASSNGKKTSGAGDVDMHVPQARNQELACSVDNLRIFGNLQLAFDPSDSPVFNFDVHPRRAGAPVASITVTF